MEKHQHLVEYYPSSLHVQMVYWECTSIVVEHYPSSLHVLMFVYMPTKLFHTKRLNSKQLPVKLECAMSNSTNVYLSGLMISCWLCRKDSSLHVSCIRSCMVVESLVLTLHASVVPPKLGIL
jgi:hypothetical protein